MVLCESYLCSSGRSAVVIVLLLSDHAWLPPPPPPRPSCVLQCVELSRRYLILRHGLTFDSIGMAYEIFDLPHARRLADGALHRWHAHRNGRSTVPPRVGSLLIWEPVGYFRTTGHVAVVVDVQPGHIDIIEQNVEDTEWDVALGCSRRLSAGFTPPPPPLSAAGAAPTGSGGGIGEGAPAFSIRDSFRDTRILGWVNHEG
jgi:hypothetical protein